MDEADLTVRALHSAMVDGSVGKGPVPSRATVADRLAGLNLTGEFVDAVATVCFCAKNAPARARQARHILNGGGRFAPDEASSRPAPLTPMTLPQSTPPIHRARRDLGQELQSKDAAELHRALSATSRQLAALRAERDALDERCATLYGALSAAEAMVKSLTERHAPPDDTVHEPPAPQAAPVTLPPADLGPDVRCKATAPTTATASSPRPQPDPGKSEGLTHRRPSGAADTPVPSGLSPAQRHAPAHPGWAPAATLLPGDVKSEQALTLPLDFQAFYKMNVEAYIQYARLHLRDDLAQEAVHNTFLALWREWAVFLGHPEPAAGAWKVLRRCVAEQTGRATSSHVVAQVMRDARATLGGMTSDLGLFSAIAELPVRQFDVIVLRYVLGYNIAKISELLGVSLTTTRSQERLAKGRLARKLDLPASDGQSS
ncbi:sigma factor-like helix-turn-helix DNA-binding protein [Streptomyces sp. NPDC051214]|uniref:sigma factor-like helix-turn-helix DNA-binding protein n=1 Tax=Streptomyces sp. NPDC051214 TaxID=3155282 RepID=UPI0034402F7C